MTTLCTGRSHSYLYLTQWSLSRTSLSTGFCDRLQRQISSRSNHQPQGIHPLVSKRPPFQRSVQPSYSHFKISLTLKKVYTNPFTRFVPYLRKGILLTPTAIRIRPHHGAIYEFSSRARRLINRHGSTITLKPFS